jgi:hypothetical protein
MGQVATNATVVTGLLHNSLDIDTHVGWSGLPVHSAVVVEVEVIDVVLVAVVVPASSGVAVEAGCSAGSSPPSGTSKLRVLAMHSFAAR